jgi:HAD superfamily hydrolase (TIGR01509 family)
LKKLILFDLDGVLLDSQENMRISWQTLSENLRQGVSFERYFSLIGRPFRDILELLELHENQDAIEEQYMRNSTRCMDVVNFYEGARNFLLTLQSQGRKIGIVTSKDGKRTGILLERLGIHFDTVQTPCSAYRGKPAPDHLLVAMAETGTDPADTIYIGDMDSDCLAAKRAGVDYIHAAWGYGSAIEAAPSAADFDELYKLIP